MKALITLIVMILTLPSWATVTSGTKDCPQEFEGKVKEIIEPSGRGGIFSKNKVVFENLRTLKGQLEDKVLLDVLQNGPFKLEEDKDYRVQLRNGKICWIEEAI